MLSFHHEISAVTWFLGFCRMCEFTDGILELSVGSIFIGQMILVQLTSEGGTHREFRNVVGKFASPIMQNPKTRKKYNSVLSNTNGNIL
jgi:hypothetical protein